MHCSNDLYRKSLKVRIAMATKNSMDNMGWKNPIKWACAKNVWT